MRPTLFDTHTHLQDERLSDMLDHDVRIAKASGIRHIVCCGTSPQDWESVLELASRYEIVIPALGLHPWYLGKSRGDWFTRLTKLSAAFDTAIGEAGLDFGIRKTDRERQYHVFIKHVKLSMERNVPIFIHCSKAWDRMLKILREAGPHPRGYILHAYSGTPQLIKPLLELNAYFSFGGTLTRPYAQRAPAALKQVPPDRLLIETDAPNMMPYDVEDTANRPQYLPIICERAAEILKLSAAEVAQITCDNGRRLFGLR